MIFEWYPIFNLKDFQADDIVARQMTVLLEGKGFIQFLVTHGNEYGVLYDDTFLIIQLGGKNPYVRDSYAIFQETDGTIWLGFEVPE